MQSGSCSFNYLEMASKRMKTFIFENAEKIKHEKVKFLMISWLLEKLDTFVNKAGYTATLVACGWAGAVLEKVTRASR